MSGQARALTPGEVQALLDGATPGPWEGNPEHDDYVYAPHATPRWGVVVCHVDVRNSEGTHHLIAAAPDLARRVLELEAQNAALAAELARAQAGAQAVEELALEWMREADDIRAQNDRSWSDAGSGVEGTLDRCADQLVALAQASAEGAGAGEVVG